MRPDRSACSALLALFGLWAGVASAQSFKELRATTIEPAPPAQIAAAEQAIGRLAAALDRCDGGALEALLPPWELRLLPLIALDAVHDTENGQVAGLPAEQLALSPYGRAALTLRAEGAEQAAALSGPQVLASWCRANARISAALLAELQIDRWQWLRQDELQLLSGCALAPVGDGRLSLLGHQGQWYFALLETLESLVGEALAGPDAATREALLTARREFLAEHRNRPPAPQPPDPLARQTLLEASVEPDPLLDRFALLIEQRAALPPCR